MLKLENVVVVDLHYQNITIMPSEENGGN